PCQAVYVADVWHNGWSSVPAEVLKLDGLVVFNASGNDIETLAEGITPQHLGVLNLSFNRLASLPPALGGSEGSWGITGGSTVRSANDSDTLAMEEEDAER
ncbi:hypothetical protein VaNZ11_010214, partial [Volvox africanus]